MNWFREACETIRGGTLRAKRMTLWLGLVLTACSASTGDSTPDAPAAEEAITAQPDPTCAYAQFGGHDYWVCTGTQNWQGAQSVCASVGMHLVRIDTAPENDFVRGRIAADTWIGASDSQTEGAWRWINDGAQFWSGKRPGTVVNGLYNKWASVDPNDLGGEDCAIVKANGDWSDIACSVSRRFVCESSAATASQPQAPDTACTRSTFNGADYWSCSNLRSWDDARANCRNVGLDLVSIDDAAEATFVKGKITRDVHIGLSDKEQEGAWRSTHSNRVNFCGPAGGNTPYGGFSNWASGHPLQATTCQKAATSRKTYWACDYAPTWFAARDA